MDGCAISDRRVSLWFCIRCHRTAPCLSFIPMRNDFQLQLFSASVCLSSTCCAARLASCRFTGKFRCSASNSTDQSRSRSRERTGLFHVGHTLTDTRLCWSVSEAGRVKKRFELRKVRHIYGCDVTAIRLLPLLFGVCCICSSLQQVHSYTSSERAR